MHSRWQLRVVLISIFWFHDYHRMNVCSPEVSSIEKLKIITIISPFSLQHSMRKEINQSVTFATSHPPNHEFKSTPLPRCNLHFLFYDYHHMNVCSLWGSFTEKLKKDHNNFLVSLRHRMLGNLISNNPEKCHDGWCRPGDWTKQLILSWTNLEVIITKIL